jgi:hypothetical protein
MFRVQKDKLLQKEIQKRREEEVRVEKIL